MIDGPSHRLLVDNAPRIADLSAFIQARKVPPKAGSVKKSKQAVESSDESRSSEVDDDD